SWSSTSASASGTTGSAGGGARGRRGRRRVAGGVADLALVVLLQVVDPGGHRRVALLRQQLAADLRLQRLVERLGRRRLDIADRLDDVVAVLRLHRPRDRVRLQEERRLVERRDGLAAGDRQLPALVLRARVLRVLLRQGGEVRARLQLVVELVGLGL